MGQKVCESSEALTSSGGAGEAVIEAGVNDEILPYWIRRRPKISDRIPMSQWLREVPHLTRNSKPAHWMRDRERLRKLCLPHFGRVVLLLHHEAVHVEVKTAQVIAQEYCRALHESAKIKFRSRTRMQSPQVLGGDGWPFVLTRQNYHLYPGENFARPIARGGSAGAVGEGLEEGQQLHSLVDRKLGHLIDAEAS